MSRTNTNSHSPVENETIGQTISKVSSHKYDIGIVGDICGVDMALAEGLARHGLKVAIFRFDSGTETTKGLGIEALGSYHTHFSQEDSFIFRNSREFVRLAFKCKILMGFTATIPAWLGWLYLIKFLPKFPKIINISTGSDIAEFLGQESWRSKRYKHHLNTSELNWMVEYPHALKNLIRHKIKNVHIWPFPGMYVCDVPFPPPPEREDVLFFFPTRQDFKVNDPGAHRYSSKGNDRFLRAFIRAIKSGLNARCAIIKHGPDVKEALAIINESGIEDRFIFFKPMSRNALFEQSIRADVVVDQFDIGGLGCTTVEALSGGRPVFTYINEECSALQFDKNLPPVINCWSEDEIYEQIMRCEDKEFLKKRGEQSREWTLNHLHWSIVLERLIFHISLMLGEPVKEYGWNTSAYADQEGR